MAQELRRHYQTNNLMENHLNKSKWILDPAHSELEFKVRHLMISNVRGEFRKFHVEVDGEDFSADPIRVRIETASIYTNDDNRDAHLRSPDFFDSEHFPEMLFESRSLTKTGDQEYKLKGLLTIKGITEETDLDLIFNGKNKDPWGNEKAGFSLKGSINRTDWGLKWNAALESGGFLVGEQVHILGEFQLTRQS
jgi:polyisoprenoid-binding protein YceI